MLFIQSLDLFLNQPSCQFPLPFPRSFHTPLVQAQPCHPTERTPAPPDATRVCATRVGPPGPARSGPRSQTRSQTLFSSLSPTTPTIPLCHSLPPLPRVRACTGLHSTSCCNRVIPAPAEESCQTQPDRFPGAGQNLEAVRAAAVFVCYRSHPTTVAEPTLDVLALVPACTVCRIPSLCRAPCKEEDATEIFGQPAM